MHTRNEALFRAPFGASLEAAADVESWPRVLSHYRDVRFLRRDGPGRGRVRMAAFRHFGPVPYPTWWVSEMVTDFNEGAIRYRHVDGITKGMDVLWRLERSDGSTRATVLHDWDGPAWPVIGRFAAERIIGPHFIHVIAGRTLSGLKRRLERSREIRVEEEPEGA